MYTYFRRARRAFVLSLAGATALVAGGCTSGGGSSQPQIPSNQPRVATYQCGEDGEIRIVNTGASVVINEKTVPSAEESAAPVEGGEQGESRFELVAAPPSQRNRYGADGLALVLEGRDALWMKAGSAPLSCTR